MKVYFMDNVYFYLVVHTTIYFRNFIKPMKKNRVPFIFQNIKPRNIIMQHKKNETRVVIYKGAPRPNKNCQTANI